MPASFVRDGKLDREAAAAELRRCLDTILRTARFHLSYHVDIEPKLGEEDLEVAEIVVNFGSLRKSRPSVFARRASFFVSSPWLRGTGGSFIWR